MKNFEHYIDFLAKGMFFAVKNGNAVRCSGTNCEECELFHKEYPCLEQRIKWLLAEHVEQPKLTVNERKLCEILNGGYLVRDRSKRLTVYGKKPRKTESWWTVDSDNCWKVDIIFDRFKDCDFSFIKWEDEVPWAVSDLLELEVAECL